MIWFFLENGWNIPITIRPQAKFIDYYQQHKFTFQYASILIAPVCNQNPWILQLFIRGGISLRLGNGSNCVKIVLTESICTAFCNYRNKLQQFKTLRIFIAFEFNSIAFPETNRTCIDRKVERTLIVDTYLLPSPGVATKLLFIFDLFIIDWPGWITLSSVGG